MNFKLWASAFFAIFVLIGNANNGVGQEAPKPKRSRINKITLADVAS